MSAETIGQPVDRLSTGEELVSAAAGIWMIIGLFLDGLAHVELKPDTFFTPWHLVLYSGFVLAATSAVWPVARRRRLERRSWRSAVPAGHLLTLGGVAIFGFGAVFDLVWHETVGFEVSNEALLSPSHLVLLSGGLLALSGPVRTGWLTIGSGDHWRRWVPMTISLALLTGIGLFFTSYVSPFGRQSATAFPSTKTHTHELVRTNAAAFAQLREIWGVAGILIATLLLVVPIVLLVRRAWPPFGVLSMLGALLAVLVPALGEFRQWTAGVAVLLAFVVGDLISQRYRSLVVVGATTAGTLWAGFFVGAAATHGVGWSPSLWSGSIFLGALLGALLGLLAGPSATSETSRPSTP